MFSSASPTSGTPGAPKRLSDLHPETVWVSRDHHLYRERSANVVRAIAALGRRANETRTLTWVARDIKTRCETGQTPRSIKDVLTSLHKTGVVRAFKAETGKPYRVVFPHVAPNRRLMLPLTVGWEYQWHAGDLTGPRYGSDTGAVLRWVLCILKVADHNGSQFLFTTTKSAKTIAKETGVSVATYERLQATAYAHLADADWVTWHQHTRDDGGNGRLTVTIDYRLLPALKTPPSILQTVEASETPAVETPQHPEGGAPQHREGGTPRNGEGGLPNELREPKRTDASEQVLEKTTASLQSSGHTAATTQAPNPKAGRAKKKEATVEDIRLADVATQGLWSNHVETPEADNTNSDYDTWLLAVVAVLVDASTPNRVGITKRDYTALRDSVRDHYDRGWVARNLALGLTTWAPPRVFADALPTRLKGLPMQPNYVPSHETRQEREDREAYERAAAPRDASRYVQHTL